MMTKTICELDKLKEKDNIEKRMSEYESDYSPYDDYMEGYKQAVEDVREMVFKIMREEQPCYASELARTLAGAEGEKGGGQG